MILHVDPVEAVWFVINFATLMLTLLALNDARRDLKVAQRAEDGTGFRSATHEARLLTAKGNVRREFLRAIVQGLLISLVVPLLFTDRPVTLSPFVIALILVAVVLFTSTFFDRRDRDRLAQLLVDLINTETRAGALEASVQENIALTRESIEHGKVAGDEARAAYHEANSVNEKIENLNERLAARDIEGPTDGR